MEKTEKFPVLYILMRTDLPSMNPGKAMAQASHASNAFVWKMNGPQKDLPSKAKSLFNNWEAQTPQGFGTVLVLGVTEAQMRTTVEVTEMLGFVADVVNDPTYPYHTTTELAKLVPEDRHTLDPVFDGDRAVLFRSEDTCAYVFGDTDDPILKAVVGNFELHK